MSHAGPHFRPSVFFVHIVTAFALLYSFRAYSGLIGWIFFGITLLQQLDCYHVVATCHHRQIIIQEQLDRFSGNFKR
jgi:hypothetical protein